MPANPKPDSKNSAKAVLTELAVEGTSSLVEAHRILLDLAQQENELILNGLRGRVSEYVPAVAMTDVVRRSVEAIITMQHEFLTNGSKQTLKWLQAEAMSSHGPVEIMDLAREGVETFARAQKKFLDAVSEESAKAMSGQQEHNKEVERAQDVKELAQDAARALIEAQKRLLDVMSQQMNVSMQAAIWAVDLASPSQLLPLASLAGDALKSFFDVEETLVSSLAKRDKTKSAAQTKRKAARRSKIRRSRAMTKREEPVTA